jgi:hypothetical protein
MKAGRLVLHELDQLAAKRMDFAFETTLSGMGYVRRIRAWKRAGYKIEIVYLKLQSARLALSRIAARRPRRASIRRPPAVRPRVGKLRECLPATGGRMDGIRQFWPRATTCGEKLNEDQASCQDCSHDCSEGGTRPSPSCERRAPNRPSARRSDLRLGERESRRADGLAVRRWPSAKPYGRRRGMV